MRDVFGPRNWVFWWAAITATVFLQDWLPTISNFFSDSGFFSPNNFPFNLVSGLNAWIDGVAAGIRNSVQFDPNGAVITSPVTVPNWIIAVVVGLLVLGGAVALYRRALKSTAIGDDILTLFGLYFILRIEGYILGFTNVGPLVGASNVLTTNPMAGFWILMLALLLLMFLGGGVTSRRTFWRGLLEAVLLALFLLPTQTAAAISTFFAMLYGFTNLLGSNVVFGILWGLIGAILALTRLTSTQPAS
jgi:hypothetical protein